MRPPLRPERDSVLISGVRQSCRLRCSEGEIGRRQQRVIVRPARRRQGLLCRRLHSRRAAAAVSARSRRTRTLRLFGCGDFLAERRIDVALLIGLIGAACCPRAQGRQNGGRAAGPDVAVAGWTAGMPGGRGRTWLSSHACAASKRGQPGRVAARLTSCHFG
jgi:hypothetical protein